VPFVRHAAVVAAWLATASASSLAFWRRELAGCRPSRLPFDRVRVGPRDFAGGRIAIAIPEHVAAGLKAVAKTHATGLFAILLAALTEAMARGTDDDDFLFVTMHSGRLAPDGSEDFEIIGPLAAPLLLRCRACGPDPSERIRAAHRVFTQALDHAAVPIEYLRAEAGLPIHPPQIGLVYQSFLPPPTIEAGPLTIHGGEPVGFGPGRASFEMEFVLWPGTDGIEGVVTFATQVFSEPTVSRLVQGFLVELARLARTAPPSVASS
jgi:hypothetical protein